MTEEIINNCAGSYIGILVLIILSYLPVFLFSEYRNRKGLIIAYLVVITAHHLVSMSNFLFWPLPGANLDAFTFHQNARGMLYQGSAPAFSIGTATYETVLYYTYSLFGACLLVGQSLTILAAGIGCSVMLRIAKYLEIEDEKWLVLLLLITGLTPSYLFYISLTFREPFQLIGFVLGVFFSVKAIEESDARYIFYAAACLLLMGLFHHILLAAAFVMIFITVTFYLVKHTNNLTTLLLKLAAFGILAIISGYWIVILMPAGEGNDYVRILRESGGVIEMIERYRAAVENNLPRSTFGYSVETTTAMGLVSGLLKSYGSYLFGPAPWSITDSLDIVPAVNSIWRFASILLVAMYFWIQRKNAGLLAIYLSTNYLFITFLWSLGTTNFGQAFRHNAISDWLLAILFVLAISHFYSNRSIER